MGRTVAPVRLWHYTVRQHLSGILADKEIRPAIIGVLPGERPAVWFSSNPLWERTARKGLMDERTGKIRELNTMAENHKYGGLVRIEADTQVVPINWAEFKRVSGIGRKVARGLQAIAREVGANPDEWYCSFAPVSIFDCYQVDEWDGKA